MQVARPPIKWHGGKFYLAKRIAAMFPPHHTYVEPFGGAASVLLNKISSPVEVYNDLDERLVRFFRVLRDRHEDLQRVLALTPYSEAEFFKAAEPSTDELEQVRRDFVRWRQSLGGREKKFSYTLHRSRREMPDVVSGYLSAIDEVLPEVATRFRTVEIMCRPALDVIAKWDSADTLFYCDPTYLPETRATKSVYRYEMTESDHRNLAAALNSCAGKVIISGYPSALYNQLYANWSRVSFDLANHAAGGKSKRRQTEVLWFNC